MTDEQHSLHAKDPQPGGAPGKQIGGAASFFITGLGDFPFQMKAQKVFPPSNQD